MKKIRWNSKKIIFLFLLIVSVCFLYLGSRSTYTAYESEIQGTANSRTAGIQLKINGFDVMSGDSSLDNRILLDNTTWVSTHTREEKISPGSSGTIDLELDPTGSDVAILYEFQFVDKVIDEDKLLNFGTITSDDTSFIRTGIDTYSGILPLADVLAGNTVTVSDDFYFDYLTDIEGITEDNQTFDDLFEIHFHALQYQGETLVPYTAG